MGRQECQAQAERPDLSRRSVVLGSVNVGVLASLFAFGGAKAQDDHYVPPWTYNPRDGRGLKKPVTKEKAFEELMDVLQNATPDGFTPTVVKQTDDYIHVEYESPIWGFKDDAEFWFPDSKKSIVEYRSASRLGENDNKINRKRIKELRKQLEGKGWSSVGYA
ncbi:hypothetical protein WJX73_007972 [Symbiochloris irregularis]|uniref:DUF1499 domain-containing protein n=1 Tax=Symbiochloris irregularis TaxID=706552 RepID=A0AAW1PWZ1_9CHLO